MSISIVINNYNYGRYLEAAVNSALNQTQAAFEVIVVDDGSTDESRQVIEGYGNRVRAIFQPNGGQASAFNTGIRAARGDWVWLLDSDDTLQPDALALAMPFMQPGLSRLVMGMNEIDRSGNVIGKRITNGCEPFEGELWETMLHGGGLPSIPTSGNLFCRNALVKTLPIPEAEFRICADAYLFVNTAMYGKVRLEPLVTACYRIHDANHFHRSAGGAPSPTVADREFENLLRITDLIYKYAACQTKSISAKLHDFWLCDQLMHAVLNARAAGLSHPALKDWPATRLLATWIRCLLFAPQPFRTRSLKCRKAIKILLSRFCS